MRHYTPEIEELEPRDTAYALSGFRWASPDISVSIMPNGTPLANGHVSNLLDTYPAPILKTQLERALATWAAVAPLNFRIVPDDGTSELALGPAQGSPHFGDIRIGGWAGGAGWLGSTYYPSPFLTRGGDVALNTSYTFHVGSQYDLYSVLLHELGHSLGLADSPVKGSVMYASITGVYSGAASDDIAGIRAIYGARLLITPAIPGAVVFAG